MDLHREIDGDGDNGNGIGGSGGEVVVAEGRVEIKWYLRAHFLTPLICMWYFY